MGIEGGKDYLEFAYTRFFERTREGLLDEEAVRLLELGLAERPRRGSVVPGTGGVRKVRVGLPGTGKSGGARVLYLYDAEAERIYLLLAFAKADQVKMTNKQRARIRKLVRQLKG